MDADERLRHTEESKTKTKEKIRKFVTKLEESHENVEKIFQEKSSLEVELKIKEQECRQLCVMQEQGEALNRLLREKIVKKQKKITTLKIKLQRKESELQSVLQEVQVLQKELPKAQKELKKKHEEVMQMHREKEELVHSYNIEKEQVSKLVQITFVLASDKEEMKVISRYKYIMH